MYENKEEIEKVILFAVDLDNGGASWCDGCRVR